MIGYNSETQKFEVYDGSNWVVVTKDYVLKAGDTMTGDLTFSGAGVETANYIGLNTSYVKNGEPVGSFVWNSDRETSDLVMPGGVTLQLGQELHFYGINQSGVDIPNGTAVMFAGSAGASGKIKIAKAVADGTYASVYMMGVTTQAIANGASGKVTFFGEVHDINTSSYKAGDILYLDPANPGGLTKTPPQAPNLKYFMAAAIDSKNNGTIFVRAIFPLALSELDDVQITTVAGNDFLVRNATNTRWENKTLSSTKTILDLTGTNSGDVVLSSPDSGLSLTGQTLAMGTPSSLTATSTNAVSGSGHTHAVSGFVKKIGDSMTGTLNVNPLLAESAISSVVNSSGDNGDVIAHYTEINQKTATNSGSLYGYRVLAQTNQTVADIQVNSTQIEVNGGSTGYAEGLTSNALVASGATLTNLSLAKMFSPTINGTVTNVNGLEIEDMSSITATNKKSIISWGGNMYHAGSVDTDGYIYSSNGKLGYSTSGSVTQGTSRATAVTLNALTGTITMFSAAVSAQANSNFTFNNSYIEADDLILLTYEPAAAANGGRWGLSPSATTSGSCSITVRNLSTGSITEATIIRFAIIKSGY